MKRADIFVIYDDAQFETGDFQHRNRIRIYQGSKWLTVPVEKKSIPIKDVKIKNENLKKGLKWNEEHFRDIKDNYRNAPYYKKYEKYVELLYEEEYNSLIDLNMEIIKLLQNMFEINSKLVFSSELGLTSKATTRLVEITEMLNGDVYLSGPGGRNYLDVSMFEQNGIKVEYQNFEHPIYKQQYRDFIPNMSSIDSLFNVDKLHLNGAE
jgi:hypothetical protein